ncbi:ABC transporter ATP-binding protein [Halorientalis litorea]|uniref:ABC transporter ATP-binding protein n=1 Tax=Halorientalis litorea TaxID=2931977 RepID=UPI001FF26E5C|nr:ABC transporter ATP-binding protein [Halorientalis litorea]
MSTIDISGLGIKFDISQSNLSVRRLFGRVFPFVDVETDTTDTYWALRDVSLTVDEGETLGIIGGNGAGKTTLLRTIAGVFEPDEGDIETNGNVSPLMSLGIGFDPSLSGRHNIYLNAAYLGLSKAETEQLVPEIIEFAELEEFIDRPVRTYSSGMKVRLGFAIATNIDPDILLLDEVMSVGDADFQEKSQRRMDEMLEQSRVIVIASHSMSFVTDNCDKAVYLEDGRVAATGNPETVVEAYTG